MAKKIDLPFIRVHENMPEHHKVEPLSDKAFRLLVETWCWSKRAKTDGHVPSALWARRGTPKARAELIAAGLVDDDLTGGVIVHDYDEWQMTSDEIDKRKDDAVKAAHERWHVQGGKPSETCGYCQAYAKDVRHA